MNPIVSIKPDRWTRCLCLTMGAAWLAIAAGLVACSSVAPAPVVASQPSASDTGKPDSGVVGVSNGQFVVTPDFRDDYLSLLGIYKAKLMALADYPADVNDGWTVDGSDWLCRLDVKDRNDLMRSWQRNPAAK